MTYSGVGDVPRQFIEVVDPPFWVSKGKPVSKVKSPRTVFLRAELVPFMSGLYGRPRNQQRWVIYGGPMTEAEYPAALQALKDWAFWAKSADGSITSYAVLDERAIIAPDGFKHQWPRRTFAWTWEYEAAPPRRYRWEQDPYNASDPGKWALAGVPMQHPPQGTQRPNALPALGFVSELGPGGRTAFMLAYSAAAGASAYHGYKRTGSVGWAFGWFVFGGIAPFFAVPLALAQGYSKPKKARR